MLGLDPGFPLKYIVYFLIVVAVGGGNIKGSLIASLILGICGWQILHSPGWRFCHLCGDDGDADLPSARTFSVDGGNESIHANPLLRRLRCRLPRMPRAGSRLNAFLVAAHRSLLRLSRRPIAAVADRHHGAVRAVPLD